MTTETPVSPEEQQARFETMKWLKQPEDERDYAVQVYRPDILSQAFSLPQNFDLRGTPHLPPGGNQLSLGSCVYWSTGRAYRFAQRKMGLPDFDPSELFGYYEGRKIRGWINEDTGSFLRDAMEVYSKVGLAEESYWPYNVSRFREQPPQAAYANAATHQVTRYLKIPDGNDDLIDAALASGYPVVFGGPIYSNFPFNNGVVDIPNPMGSVIGGHAMMWVHYDRVTRKRSTLNQWGDGWGENGFAYMSYDYCRQMQDLWIITDVEGQPPPPPPPPPAKVVDGIGLWTPEKGIVHLWPPRPFEQMDETVGGIGIHYTDGTTEGIWPKA